MEKILIIKDDKVMFKIDRPDDCQTWFLWQDGDVVRTGDLGRILNDIQEVLDGNMGSHKNGDRNITKTNP